MGDTYKTTRVYRERRESDSDDERFNSTIVTRYKVDDDRRLRHNNHRDHHPAEFVEYERREHTYAPDRPRSRLDERPRTIVYEQDIERERRDDWDRRSRHDRHDDDVKIEKRTEERFEDAHGHEIERYRKETEYYHQNEPPSSPVVIRQRAPDQKIIVHEAAPQAPIIVPRPEPSVIVLREREADREMGRGAPYDEEYYYRHERREVGPYRGDRDRDRDRDHDWGMVKHDRRRRDEDYWSDDDNHYRRHNGRRERSESPNHRHMLHLAEGALAGAGVSALLASRRDKNGEIGDHRGRKVIAGATMGALGTEILKRAHSAYEDTWNGGRESPDHHSTLKKTVGVVAVALAAAGVAKLYEANKIEKEEARRGRSRGREYSSGDEYSRSRSRPRPKSRHRSLSTFAKAAVGTAVTAGVVKHLHNKSKSRSRSRHSRHASRSRSKSRLRRGAELAGAAAAAGVAGKMWKDHHDKKKREGPMTRGQSDDEDDRGHHRRRSVSRSRSESRNRSRARSLHSDSGADPGLGLIEYGRDPIDPGLRSASGRGYEAEEEERRRNRRSRRDRSASSDSDSAPEKSRSKFRDAAVAAGAGAVGLQEYKDRQDKENKQSKEKRAREDREKAKEDEQLEREHRDREREREREKRRERKERERQERERGRDQNQRRDNEAPPDNSGGSYNGHHPQSPPTFSGGAYFPPYSTTSGAGPGYQNPPYRGTASAPPQREYTPYVPQDYIAYAPPPPPAGPPPPSMSGANGGYEPPLSASAPPMGPGAPPPPGPTLTGDHYPPPPDHVSDHSRSRSRRKAGKPEGVNSSRRPRASRAPLPADVPPSAPTPPPQLTKSVSFSPLSPKSSKTMQRHRRQVDSGGSDAEEGSRDRISETRSYGHRRRTSDTTYDRPRNAGIDRQGNYGTDSEDEVENLPERFDSQGRPLVKSGSGSDRWTSRSGSFHREAQKPSDWNIGGAWSVGGTDPEQVDRLVRQVTGALEGRNSWMGVLGEVLGSGLLQGSGSGGDQQSQDVEYGPGRREREGDGGDVGEKLRKRKR